MTTHTPLLIAYDDSPDVRPAHPDRRSPVPRC